MRLAGCSIFLLLAVVPALFAQAAPRRFTRTPYFTGPDDPARGQIRGSLQLGETVIIDVPGDTGDTDLKPGVVPDPGVTPPRGSRPAGPFVLEGIKAGEWVALKILNVEPGPYGYCNNHGPFRGPLRSLVPVKNGMVYIEPDFAIPMRPSIGFVQFQSAAALAPGTPAWDNGGNMDFNSVRAGSTVYIRAQRPGAMLTLADVHAYMSDGELTGTGVEIDATVTLKAERGPKLPTGGVVVETADRWYTEGIGANWEEAVKNAFAEMVALVTYLHHTTVDHANRIVGTVGDVVPGFAAGAMNFRGFQRPSYITLQISIPKNLRRTGEEPLR